MKIKQKIAIIVLALVLLFFYWQYRAYVVQVTRGDVTEEKL